MFRSTSRTESATARESAAVFGDAFQQVAQGLGHLQEAFRLQGQEAQNSLEEALRQHGQEAERRMAEAMRRQKEEAERRLQEVVRLQEERATAALREAVSQIERKLQEKEECIRELHRRVDALERGRVAGDTAEGVVGSPEDGALKRLEGRMQQVEASLQSAMQNFFPRVDGLLRHLEETSPQGTFPSSLITTNESAGITNRAAENTEPRVEPRASTSACVPTSTCISSSTPVSPFSLSASACRTSTTGRQEEAGAGQGRAPEDEGFQRLQIQLRLEEARAKKESACASPSPLGEDLIKAAGERRIEDVSRLIDSGADVNYIGQSGVTLLQIASCISHDDVVALLLRRGADPNAVDIFGSSAMHLAASVDRSGRCVSLLIGAGGDVNARNEDGETPLHWAADNNNAAAVRALLGAGARRDLNAWDGRWKDTTPFDIATNSEIRDLLRA